MTQKEKRKEWEEKLLACEASGQTVSAFCEAQGISQSSFYYWHKKLNTKETEQTHPITWLPFMIDKKEESTFDQLSIEIQQVKVTVSKDCDRDLLRDVLNILLSL